ncbi:hypothetical protein [Streptomyces tateyamensis]|uniref:hypothetical protein n=1 Tax=Streptomyces tateyamensis TaxID=565073 RepID=UPI0011B7EA0F|nr:hypothetical protein [Streptomyces tateyamensis]
MTHGRTEPRIGPATSLTGELTIWVRIIRGRTLTFWAWPDDIAVYRVDGENSPELIRTFTRETT